MNEVLKLTLPVRFGFTVHRFSNLNALAFVGEKPLTYSELSGKINDLTRLLKELKIQPGDKVSIYSTNMPNWGIAYFAITFMGAVAVPLLPDFLPSEIENIINHSETKMVFVSEKLSAKLEPLELQTLVHIIRIEDFTVIKTNKQKPYLPSEQSSSVSYEPEEEDLAAIIYTSGTTGMSKGVMLSHKNICTVAENSTCVRKVTENDRLLSILPLSHTYENTLGFVMPMLKGSCVYYLTKQPTPSVLLPALLEVKPTIMFAVPLIIEKIYHNRILPTFTKMWPVRQLYKVPFIRKILNRLAGKKLLATLLLIER